MKKTTTLLLLCLLFLPLQAQNRFSFSLEVEAGGGFGNGPRMVASPQFVAQYELGSGFKVGAGAGLRYANPCYNLSIRYGEESREYCHDISVPVFLRATYGSGILHSLYASVDAGYTIGVFMFVDGFPALREHTYNGLFLEPQVGWVIGEHSALVLGALLQQGTLRKNVISKSGDIVSAEISTQKELTPAITLRYCYTF